MIEIRDLYKAFISKSNLKRIKAVNKVNLSFEKGVYGLLGPNGSGKTTMLRCIMGLYKYKGEILFNSQSLKNNQELICKIGYLPQQFDMFKELKLYEMMQYFASMKGIAKNELNSEVMSALKTVNLEEQKDCKVKALSGGMKRRAGIAQAILGKPELIILDEPTVGLDVEERLRFKNIIKSIGKTSTVILSTHIIEDVEAVCDKIIIMKNGEILTSSSRNEISEFAKGKVFEYENGKQPDNLEIQRVYERNGKEYVKVISASKINGEEIEPSVEDGYLCLIKGI